MASKVTEVAGVPASSSSNTLDEKKQRVLVAMSGGVDSSAAAALLVEQGYEVLGITMQVWDYSTCEIEEGNGTCCSSKDVDDARSVADKLGIAFYVLNCEAKFQAYVIDPFIESYLAGQTPLPCVNCNTYLKFDHLFEKMRELDCDFLATGHYAQILQDQNGQSQIVTSTDDWKDQTYFLFTLKPDLVDRLMFPIGHLKKPDVRAYAEKMGLVNHKKKDSTGICFIGNKGYGNFIKEHVASDLLKKGNFKRFPSGEILGSHDGIHNFTYGQRKGFGLTHHETLFVIKVDAESQTVWLGEEKYLFVNKLKIKKVNWLRPDDEVLASDAVYDVKIRYQHQGAKAKVKKVSDEEYELDFEVPQRAVTPGQAAVFYQDKKLIGGGWIFT
jgi:tRNA-specific 2-thiouridylase